MPLPAVLAGFLRGSDRSDQPTGFARTSLPTSRRQTDRTVDQAHASFLVNVDCARLKISAGDSRRSGEASNQGIDALLQGLLRAAARPASSARVPTLSLLKTVLRWLRTVCS